MAACGAVKIFVTGKKSGTDETDVRGQDNETKKCLTPPA